MEKNAGDIADRIISTPPCQRLPLLNSQPKTPQWTPGIGGVQTPAYRAAGRGEGLLGDGRGQGPGLGPLQGLPHGPGIGERRREHGWSAGQRGPLSHLGPARSPNTVPI